MIVRLVDGFIVGMIIGEKVCFEVIVGRIDGLAGRLVGLCVGRVDFAAFGLSVRLAEGFIVSLIGKHFGYGNVENEPKLPLNTDALGY